MALKVDGAPDGLAITVIPIGQTPVQISPARRSRQNLFLVGLNSFNNCYLGTDSLVTPATGMQATAVPVPLPTAAAIWAVCAPNFSASVAVLETYDVEN